MEKQQKNPFPSEDAVLLKWKHWEIVSEIKSGGSSESVKTTCFDILGMKHFDFSFQKDSSMFVFAIRLPIIS